MKRRYLTTALRQAGVLTLVVVVSTRAQSQQPQAQAPDFRTITVGQHFSCGLAYGGEAFCWGANYYGQLGAAKATGIARCASRRDLVSTCALLPVAVPGHRFTDLSAGLKHVCGVSTDKTVWCWGRNEAGQLGAPTSTTCSPRSRARGLEEFAPGPCSFEPVAVRALPPARLVATGDNFSCALGDDDDAVYCWGGSAGAPPRRLSPPGSPRFMTISAGSTNVCAVADDSRVACWSLYEGISVLQWSTVEEGLWGVATSNHTCAIGAQTNLAYCWGYNAHGSLGTGSHKPNEVADVPQRVAGTGKYVGMAVSYLGTCALDVTRAGVSCWGAAPAAPQPDRCRSGGEFGGSSRCALTPQVVFPRKNYSSVAIAVSHGCVLAATTNAYCWGANDFGQLGNGTTRAAMKEAQLVGVSNGATDDSIFALPSRPAMFIGALIVLGAIAVRWRRPGLA